VAKGVASFRVTFTATSWDAVRMGLDDDADCVEHQWVLRGASMTPSGAQVDYRCGRCGAVMVETGDELTGRTG